MTKDEFYEKWKVGSREATVFYNREEMLNDLDRVIHKAVLGWKDFTDMQCQLTVDIDEFLKEEATAIQRRKN